jgi:hypothetical protein
MAADLSMVLQLSSIGINGQFNKDTDTLSRSILEEPFPIPIKSWY